MTSVTEALKVWFALGLLRVIKTDRSVHSATFIAKRIWRCTKSGTHALMKSFQELSQVHVVRAGTAGSNISKRASGACRA